MVLVSVVIPLYNKKDFIERAIRSVLAQTIIDFEIIIVDDGSTDGSVDELKTIQDNRIRIIRQKNFGVAVARNNGVKTAIADFITFLDADDEWLPGHLEALLRLRKRYPEAGAYTTAYQIREFKGKTRLAHYKAIPEYPWEGLIPSFFKSAATGESPLNSSTIGVTKAIFYDVGGYPENVWWGEDADFWGRIALKYPIAFSWEVGAIYHWDASDRVCGKPVVDVEPIVITGRKELKTAQLEELVRKDLEEYIARKELYRAASLLFTGNTIKARDILINTPTRYYKLRKNLLFSLSFLPQSIIRSVLGGFFE